MERVNLKKLNEVEGKEQYHVEVRETIREGMKISAKESLGYYYVLFKSVWIRISGCSLDDEENIRGLFGK
jgi:hypothetical protein